MYHRTWGQMSNSRFLKGSSPPGAEPGTWLLAPPSVGFTLSRLSHFCWREAMIHQFIHFFVIWILSFQHLSSPVTCSFGQLWGCCLFLGYSLWYVVDLEFFFLITSDICQESFWGNFVHHTDTNMLAKGIWNYMHSNTNILSKGIYICMHIIVFGGTGRQLWGIG